MDAQELKNQFKYRDRTLRVISKDGFFRVALVKNSVAARVAQEKHQLDYLPAFLLARTLSAASLISTFLKGEERISVDAEGSGPISRVYAEAMHIGETRGFVRFAPDAENLTLTKLKDALGTGLFRVSRILYNRSEPIQGIVPLVTGDISTDLARYFVQSEQIPSSVVLDVSFDNDGLIEHSGGLIAQAMPGHSGQSLIELYAKLSDMGDMTEYFRKNMNLEEIAKAVLPFEFTTLTSSPLDFFCRCSKERFMEKLVTLGREELEDMQRTAPAELVCQYCNSKYNIENEDFDKMITELKIKEN